MNSINYNNLVNDFLRSCLSNHSVFHVSHLLNVIQIIKSGMIKSRNLLGNNFTNSAGCVVNRTSKAHDFARFYFHTHTPTLFHFEGLGIRKDTEHYTEYQGLKSPKCPFPVFIELNIEEIIKSNPDAIYYANGNAQADTTEIFQIGTEECRYCNNKNQSDDKKKFYQQEFLVKNYIDLHKLKHVKLVFQNDDVKDLYLKILNNNDINSPFSCTVDNTYFFNHNYSIIPILDEIRNSLTLKTDYNLNYHYEIHVKNFNPNINPIMTGHQDNIQQSYGNTVLYVSATKDLVEIFLDEGIKIYFCPENNEQIYLLYEQ